MEQKIYGHYDIIELINGQIYGAHMDFAKQGLVLYQKDSATGELVAVPDEQIDLTKVKYRFLLMNISFEAMKKRLYI
jgi:hypothetical protein